MERVSHDFFLRHAPNQQGHTFTLLALNHPHQGPSTPHQENPQVSKIS